jgi:hypothetical protein
VSVIVIDCTTIGAPPPTWTRPTFTPTVRWSFKVGIEFPMIAFRAARLDYSARYSKSEV